MVRIQDVYYILIFGFQDGVTKCQWTLSRLDMARFVLRGLGWSQSPLLVKTPPLSCGSLTDIYYRSIVNVTMMTWSHRDVVRFYVFAVFFMSLANRLPVGRTDLSRDGSSRLDLGRRIDSSRSDRVDPSTISTLPVCRSCWILSRKPTSSEMDPLSISLGSSRL